MKKNLFLFYFIILLFATACSSSTPEFDDTLPVVKPIEAPVSIETNNELLQIPSTGNVAINPPHGEPGHDCNIAVGAPLNGTVAPVNTSTTIIESSGNPVNNSSTNGVRLNPPHGEPGHDCNVMVGQPLSKNSKASDASFYLSKALFFVFCINHLRCRCGDAD